MSILARRIMLPSGCLPARISRNRRSDSCFGRSRNGELVPALGQRAARLARLVGALLVDVRVAGLDQVLGKAIHVLEVIARVVQVRFGSLRAAMLPVEADPAHGVEDAVDELLVFLDRVGVVEAHVAAPAEVARQPEVQADALGVADVQVAVGLRRKAGADLGRVGRCLGVQVVDAGLAGPVARLVGAVRQVGDDLVADEVGRRGRLGGMRLRRRLLGLVGVHAAVDCIHGCCAAARTTCVS